MNNRYTFDCYFCNQTIQNDTQQNHIAICGSVLEPCSHKCGSYIARNMKAKHSQICVNNAERQTWIDGTSMTQMKEPTHNPPLYYLNGTRTVGRKFSEGGLRNVPSAEANKEIAELRTETIRLSNQHKNILQFYSKTQMELDTLKSKVNIDLKRLRDDNEVTVHNIKESIKEFERLQLAINTQKFAFKEEQINIRESIDQIREQVHETNAVNTQQNSVVNKLYSDQQHEIERIQEENKELETKLTSLDEKYESLSFEIRTSNELSADCLTKIEEQNKVIDDIKSTITQLKLDVELAEDTYTNIQGLISTRPGRIIWKLTDFTLKMENAKRDSKVALKGPIFYTKDYGYRIRLLLYLNGFKKWKGRHMLGCLHVMKGEYDALLQWPSKIEANVILKDCEYEDSPKDYARFITAKREGPNDEAEDPQESSTQYIFIPHSTLTKSNYLKDDTIFVEILVNDGKRKNETQF